MLGFAIGVLYTILPNNYLNAKLFPIKEEDITNDKYVDQQKNFFEV